MASRVRLAVTLGDARGIGPEIAVAAARSVAPESHDLELVLVGCQDLVPDDLVCEHVPGTDMGSVTGRSIEIAVALALSGKVHGIVTGPIHKPSLQSAGFSFPGHTEMLKALADVDEVGMLMSAEATGLGGPLRVLLATTHLPLREVPSAVTALLIESQTRLLHEALKHEWGIPGPRIALCALNPHASDDGLFGDEEALVMLPAVEALRASGIDVSGPIPADTVFVRTLGGEFDAIVAPYHDVGMAGFKTASFGSGVNVTLGLPFVRTSPDHGTAFDLAGTGRADPSSMIEAVRVATRLARARFDRIGA